MAGEILTRLLMQPAACPVSDMQEILIFYAYGEKMLNKLTEQALANFQKSILNFVKSKYPDFYQEFSEKKTLTPEVKDTLNKILADFFSIKKLI